MKSGLLFDLLALLITISFLGLPGFMTCVQLLTSVDRISVLETSPLVKSILELMALSFSYYRLISSYLSFKISSISSSLMKLIGLILIMRTSICTFIQTDIQGLLPLVILKWIYRKLTINLNPNLSTTLTLTLLTLWFMRSRILTLVNCPFRKTDLS